MPVSTRAALAYLALNGIVVGLWAYGFPTAFYQAFPGFGRTWVSIDGPYNEHLVRDTGAAFLLVAALASFGLWRPAMASPAAVGAATLVFNGLHFVYHIGHLEMFSAVDRVLNVVALGSAVVCSAWLMTPQARVRA